MKSLDVIKAENRWMTAPEQFQIWELQRILEETKALDKRTELQKFRDLLSRDCLKTVLNFRVIDESYIFKNKNGPNNLLFTIEPWSIDGVEGSKNWVMYLRRFYVVSSERGKGYAKEFIKWIKLCSEISSMAVCLVASQYELSANNTDEGGFFTQTLIEVIELDSKQVIHHLDFQQEYIEDFYRTAGFVNARILPPIAEAFHAASQQFIYLPKSISKDNLRQIEKVLV